MVSDESHGRQWIVVPPEIAAQSRHYGLGGWLAVFLLVLGVVTVALLVSGVRIAAILWPIFDRLPRDWQLWGLLVLALLLWLAVASSIVLWRAVTHRRSFPRSMLRLLVLNALASLVARGVNHHLLEQLGAYPQLGETVMKVLGSWIGCALLAWYFTASKRVNATYLHRLDAADPGTAALRASAEFLRALEVRKKGKAGEEGVLEGQSAAAELEEEGAGQEPPLTEAPGLRPPPASAR